MPLSYLGFLEEECAAYVTMTNIDSPVWNPVRERLLEVLAQHIDGKTPPNNMYFTKIREITFCGDCGD